MSFFIKKQTQSAPCAYFAKLVLVSATSLLLAACSGSKGGGDSAPPPPKPNSNIKIIAKDVVPVNTNTVIQISGTKLNSNLRVSLLGADCGTGGSLQNDKSYYLICQHDKNALLNVVVRDVGGQTLAHKAIQFVDNSISSSKIQPFFFGVDKNKANPNQVNTFVITGGNLDKGFSASVDGANCTSSATNDPATQTLTCQPTTAGSKIMRIKVGGKEIATQTIQFGDLSSTAFTPKVDQPLGVGGTTKPGESQPANVANAELLGWVNHWNSFKLIGTNMDNGFSAKMDGATCKPGQVVDSSTYLLMCNRASKGEATLKTYYNGNVSQQFKVKFIDKPASGEESVVVPEVHSINPPNVYHSPAFTTFTVIGKGFKQAGFGATIKNGTCQNPKVVSDTEYSVACKVPAAGMYDWQLSAGAKFIGGTLNVEFITAPLAVPDAVTITKVEADSSAYTYGAKITYSDTAAFQYDVHIATESFIHKNVSQFSAMPGYKLIANVANNPVIIELPKAGSYFVVMVAKNADGKFNGTSNEMNFAIGGTISAPSKINDTGVNLCGLYGGEANPNEIRGNTYNCDNAILVTSSGRKYDIPAGQDGHYGTGVDGHTDLNLKKTAGYEGKCVDDLDMKLMWEVKQTSGLHDYKTKFSWYNTDDTTNGGDKGHKDADGNDTETYIGKVNAEAYCGCSKWRLPTPLELYSLLVFNNKYDEDNSSAYLDKNFFPNNLNKDRSQFYWTSQPGMQWGKKDGAIGIGVGKTYAAALSANEKYKQNSVRLVCDK